jgi:hypothetical protein
LAIVFHFRGAWRDGLQVEIKRVGAQTDSVPQVAGLFDILHCMLLISGTTGNSAMARCQQ